LRFLLRHSAIFQVRGNPYFEASMKTAVGNTARNFYSELKETRRLFLFSAFFFYSLVAHSQTTNISGVVNSYYKVVEIIPAKAAIRVSNISGLNMNDKVMIIQMKGASVNTTNTSSFGDTTNLNNAGNYEIGTICSVQDDTAFLFFNLVNQYTVSDKVQLIKFAEYYSANVVDTIKAASWDSTSGTGGVIAICVATDLSLNAPVYADATGFKGGSAILSTGGICLSATAYTYNPNSTNPQNGATKGESVATIASNISGGRGAPANGGGGGNYHNNGGGGGANLAIGGNGGGTSSFTGCTGNYKGLAGKALSNWNGKKIFAGGGGGAGHFNNNIPTHGGGNGGGIIFITAKNFSGNGYKVSGNGQVRGSNISDGASGGGAGGTIIMDILNSYNGSAIIQANGGNGGNENDGLSSGRCYGAGGGGGAGVVYFTGATPGITVNVNGGNAGLEISSDPSCSVILPSPGSSGTIISNYSYTRSTDPSGFCSLVLPLRLLYFKATLNQNKTLLEWEITNPEMIQYYSIEKLNNTNSWKNIGDIIGNDNIELYHFIDNNSMSGINQYRLKMVEKDSKVNYSPVQKVFIDFRNEFEIYPNPTTGQLNVTGDFTSSTILELTDLAGKIIWTKNLFTRNHIIRLYLPSLHPGIYIMRINYSMKKLVIH